MKYYPNGNRFDITDSNRPVENPYDVGSQIPSDLKQRGIQPVATIRLNLNTSSLAQAAAAASGDNRWVSGQFRIPLMGRAFVLYGFDNSNNASALIRTVNTTALVWVSFEQPLQLRDPAAELGTTSLVNQVDAFPAKHSRGFRGPFTELYLSWPAQTNVSADFVIHRYKYEPWVNGESAT